MERLCICFKRRVRNEKLIIDFIKNNPDITKEDVVNSLDGTVSRMTVYKIIGDIVKQGLIINKKDSRINRLSINKQHLLVSLKQDLELFKGFYFKLIDNTKGILSKLFEDPETFEEGSKLMDALIMPYKCLIIMYITSDWFLWKDKPLDNDTLHKRFAITSSNIQETHKKLYEIISGNLHESDAKALSKVLNDNPHGFNHDKILLVLETFEKYQLSETIEARDDIGAKSGFYFSMVLW
jgi:hypothetical protein